MLRITALDRSTDHEVYAVRFVGGIVILPAVLLVVVLAIVWVASTGGWTVTGLVVNGGLALLFGFLVWLMAASWRAVEVTVEPDRLRADVPLGAILASPISWKGWTSIDPDESIAPDPVRTGSSRYGVVLASSERVVVDGFPSRRSASTMADLLMTSLSRLRARP